MTTPFPFTAGQVLTATQMNNISTLIINDKTDSYTLVAGDVGERVIMNKATATTITVPDSVFATGDMVMLANKGAGTCTVTAGAGATVNTSGSLQLTQYSEGTLLALSASSFMFFPGSGGANWQTYTPTFTNFTLGNGTTNAKYIQIGKFVAVEFEITLGSTSSMSTAPTISLPVTATAFFVNALAPLGWCSLVDTGVNTFLGFVTQGQTTSTALLFRPNVSGTNIERGNVTSTTPFSWGNNDAFAGLFFYEAA